MIQLFEGDCLSQLNNVDSASVGLVLADPPYGTTTCAWDSVIPLRPLWRELKRVTRPGAAIVMTGSQPFTSSLVMSNPTWFHCEWIWRKTFGGNFLNANRQPLKRHENAIVFCECQPVYNPQKSAGEPYRARSHNARSIARGSATTSDPKVAGWETVNQGDRFPVSVLCCSQDTGLHPTQKPVALMEYFIRTYSNPGDTVLDFCMGSGTTGIACLNTWRNFIGIERDPDFYRQAEARLHKRLEHQQRRGGGA